MSVRDESQGRVTTVILAPPGRPAGAAEALANRGEPVGQDAGTGRHGTPVA